MGFTVYYKGNLKQPEDLTALFESVNRLVNKYGWRSSIVKEGLIIEIPESEGFSLCPQNGRIQGMTKFLSNDNTIDQFFEFLRLINPYFKKLDIDDDFGAWHNYIANFSIDKLPLFRELKEIEIIELANMFFLPKGSTSIFDMNQTQAIMMFIICKDLNEDLSKIVTMDNLLKKIDVRTKGWPDSDHYNFISIVDTWFLTKLHDKKGKPIERLQNKYNGSTIFSWFMGEIIFKFWGGSLGSKHQKPHRLIDDLNIKGINLDVPDNFLRLIYSAMEYCGGYRSDDLITRCK